MTRATCGLYGILPLLALALAGCHSPAAPVVKPRKVKSSYAVGTRNITLEDKTRPTPANGGVPSVPYRSLNTDIFYPAVASATAAATPFAPLDPTGAPYPLVIFVHGSDGASQQYTYLTEALAARGYVVVAGNFPLTWINQPGNSSDLYSNMQVGDVSFLADQLAEMAGDAKDPLHGAISPSDGYAVAGHSTGGTVSLASAYGFTDHDDRVQAIVALAPCACFFATSFFKTRIVPMMVLAGTDDGFVPPADNGERAFALSNSPRWLAMLTGGQHLFFTDLDATDASISGGLDEVTMNDSDISVAFSADGAGNACVPNPVFGTDPIIPFDLQHSLTVALAAGFLDEQMFGDPTTLAAVTTNPDPHLKLQQAGY